MLRTPFDEVTEQQLRDLIDVVDWLDDEEVTWVLRYARGIRFLAGVGEALAWLVAKARQKREGIEAWQ